MRREDIAWPLGQVTVGTLVKLATSLRQYGVERITRQGGLVFALNHFSWLDPPAFAARSPRPIFYMAKREALEIPVVGPFISLFGTFAVRRGESDREAVRRMREIVRHGDGLGVFVEGTRQKERPGSAQPGAAMVAIQESVPV